MDSVVAGHDLLLMLTLEDFERECEDLFDCVPALMQQAPPLSTLPHTRPPTVLLRTPSTVVVGGSLMQQTSARLSWQPSKPAFSIVQTRVLNRPRPLSWSSVCIIPADPRARAGGWLRGHRLSGEVVLVGGATRIPCVQRKMGRLVAAHGATIKKTIDLDRAVRLRPTHRPSPSAALHRPLCAQRHRAL